MLTKRPTLVILTLLLMSSCWLWKPDNALEEAIEDKIEDVTGLDIDLSADDEEL